MDTTALNQKTTVSKTASHTDYIRPLAGLSRSAVARVGAKAANLGELATAGFPVPEGFVLTTDAFDLFMADHAIDSGSTPEAVTSVELPLDVEQAIRQAIVSIGDVPLAVRSSGVAEDLPGASYAGQYETSLDVRGLDAVLTAVRQCWASAFNPRLATYWAAQGQTWPASMAVLIQRLVQAEAAGVAFTANPVTGDRSETIINSVRGLGERLVSGQASPDEWLVHNQEAICLRSPENSIEASQAIAIAELARRAEARFGNPQDVEWAIADGKIFLLQSRPMTALLEPIEWKAPQLPGVWIRNFRLGEWLGDPVTPLFESWLLTSLGNRLNADFQKNTGFPPPQAPHAVINGWYFYCWNIPDNPIGLLPVMLTKFLPKLFIQPRRASMAFPSAAHFGVELWVWEWRTTVLPRYQEAVRNAERRIEGATPTELVALIDELADQAGDYFASIIKVSGFASKAEFALGKFYGQHLYPLIGGHYSRLLRGLYNPSMQKYPHAVESIDWYFPTLGERGALLPNDTEAQARQVRLASDRQAAEAEARLALAGQPKLLAKFERLLENAQRFAPMREEQVY